MDKPIKKSIIDEISIAEISNPIVNPISKPNKVIPI